MQYDEQLTCSIKKLAEDRDVDLVGVASIDRFEGAPKGCSYYQDRGLPHMGRNGYTFRCGLCLTACPVGSEISKRETIDQGIRPVTSALGS